MLFLLKLKIDASAKDLFILHIGTWAISNEKHFRKQNDGTENGREQNFLELEIRCFNVNSLIAMVIYLPNVCKSY